MYIDLFTVRSAAHNYTLNECVPPKQLELYTSQDLFLEQWRLVRSTSSTSEGRFTNNSPFDAAPIVDEALKPDDAADVLEELLDAQNQSYVLGLKLKLPLSEVDAIHSTYSNPRDRLLQITIAFLKQVTDVEVHCKGSGESCS